MFYSNRKVYRKYHTKTVSDIRMQRVIDLFAHYISIVVGIE